MKKYAVSYISFFDNVLKLEIVKASGWKDALNKAFGIKGVWLPDDYKAAQEDAFSGEYMFAVKEVS